MFHSHQSFARRCDAARQRLRAVVILFHSHQSFARRCDGSCILPALGEIQSPKTPVFSQNPEWVETLAGLRSSRVRGRSPTPLALAKGCMHPGGFRPGEGRVRNSNAVVIRHTPSAGPVKLRACPPEAVKRSRPLALSAKIGNRQTAGIFLHLVAGVKP